MTQPVTAENVELVAARYEYGGACLDLWRPATCEESWLAQRYCDAAARVVQEHEGGRS